MYKSYDFISIYPEIFLIGIILFLISYLVIYDYFFNYKIILQNVTTFFSILSLLLIVFLLFNNLYINYLVFHSLIINDAFSLYIKFIVIFFLIFLFLLSIDYLRDESIYYYEYFLIILLSLLGLIVLVSSYDLISMYLAIELQSLCFYILATFKQYSNFSTEAGIKYFILGAFSSGILLFGCSLIYGFTGLTDFYSLQLLFQNSFLPLNILNGFIIGILFILVGLFFKLGAAPFHMWVPDVYEGSPTIITAFFAIIPKIVIISLLIRFSLTLLNYSLYYFNNLLLLCSFLSLIIGSLSALYQIKLKRLLAYSGISHVGFLIIGLSIMSLESFYSLLFYILIYMILSLNIFSILLSIRKWSNNLKIKKINEVIYLLKSNYLLAIILCITLFSMAGIPPLIGFYSKFYIFMVGLYSYFYLIVIGAAIISVISAMYYIKLIKLMFFKQFSYHFFFKKISYFNSLIISGSFLINFLFLFLPGLLIIFLHNILLNLFI